MGTETKAKQRRHRIPVDVTTTFLFIRSDPETGGERVNAATERPREDGALRGLTGKSGPSWPIDGAFLGDL